MTEQRVAVLERQVSELKSEVANLNRRIEKMLSRKGGQVEGQIHLDGWIQLEQQGSIPTTPTTDLVRIVGIDNGGIFQIVALFPNGTTYVIAQE